MGKVLWVLAIIGATLVGLAYMGSQVNSRPRISEATPFSCLMQDATHVACTMTLPADVAAQPVGADMHATAVDGWCRSLAARPDGAAWNAVGTVDITMRRPDGSTYYQTTIAPGSCQ